MDASGMISYALIVQLFVLLNPLSSITVLMAAYKQKMNVKRIALFSVATAFLIAVLITFVGPYLFSLFGVTVDSFRIAGGIVLLLLGLSTIRPHESEKISIEGVNSLISIIATPLLTGPATISFITITVFEIGPIAMFFNIILAFILVGIVFVMFAHLIPRINIHLVDISSRILGLFLTAVAIEMIAKGAIALIRA